ncbi:MAG TPA: hypothetical protein PKY73_13170, partial [Hyphomonas sp.]|nr:hypothetical protein [Hyphomonas sp.]
MIVILMFAVLAIMFAAFAAALCSGGFWGTSLGFIGATALTLLLARVMVREFFFRQRWRVRLDAEAAWLDLPASRLLFGNEPALSGPLPYSEIDALEWREEAVRSFGMAAVNRVYAVRLKSGGAILLGEDRPMRSASADGITIVNFGMGSPNAATIMDLLSAIQPQAVLFLGKCGGLKKKSEVGDFI